MRPFRFPLETALGLRRRSVEVLEAELSALAARQTASRERAAECERQGRQARDAVREGAPLDGASLRAAESAAAGWAAQGAQARESAGMLEGEVQRAREALAEAHRKLRALEDLRARRRREWTAEAGREEEAAAAEGYLARFVRERSRE